MSTFAQKLAVVAATVFAALGFGLVHAGAAQAQTYVVCGYGTAFTLGSGGSSCTTLAAAVTAAEATFGADTIDMLPGTYCPIDLEGSIFSPIAFVGVGLAGLDLSGGPVSLSGPEAGLTTFKYDSAHCGSTPSAVVKLNAFVSSGPPITFENLTIDASGGPSYGVYSSGNSADLRLRDVVVENAPTLGVYYVTGFSAFHDYALDVENSAIVDNGAGVQVVGFGSVYDTTVSGNTTGIDLPNNYDVSLGSDTISHNATGVVAGCCGNNLQVVDTVVAGNTQDCGATSDWESPSPSSWNNLVGSFSCPTNGANDVRNAGVTVAALGENGGPTPSITPPSGAPGAGASPCGLQGVDQREYVVSGGSCDIGAVQLSANGTPNVSAPAVALDIVDTGIAAFATADVQSLGGDIVGVSGISISGAGWRIVSDGCTYALLTHASNGSFCQVGVSVTPTGDGVWDGTLTVHTTAGTEHIALTSQAVTRATGQDDAYDVPDASLDVAAPGVLANDQVGATVDEVVTQPANGTLTGPSSDGSFTYTPDGGFIGDDSFQYTVIAGGLYESHPITVTLHVLGFTLSLDSASYASTPGGTFTIEATVTPLRNFTGDVCFDLADTNGSTWPSSVSQGSGYPSCSSGGEEVVARADVTLDGTNPAIVDLPVNVAADAAPGLQPLEVIASSSSAPSVVAPFGLTLPTTDAPSISDFHPSVGGAGATVTINGSNLTGATAVTFGSTAAASFTVDSDSQITAVVGSGATGHIAVTTPLGTATSSGTFTFAPPPTITNFTPGSGGVHATVTLTGTNLALTTRVQLNGASCPFAVVSATQLTFTVPTGATSGTVHVTTPGGSITSASSFTVSPPPAITSISPGSGPIGTSVTITGTNLLGTVGVMLGSVVAVPTSVSATHVVFTIPPGAVTGTIRILNAAGSATSSDTFTVTG